jgi:hypothetical protein
MAQGADAAVCLQVLREDHQLQELVPANALAAAPVKEKDAKLDEALAKECQATLSYAEHTLVALARTLPWEAVTEAQETLFLSLAAKSAGNAVLRRGDLLIEQMKRLSSSHLKGSLRTTPLSGTYLFHDSLPDTVEAQQKSDALYRPPAPAKSGTSSKRITKRKPGQGPECRLPVSGGGAASPERRSPSNSRARWSG